MDIKSMEESAKNQGENAVEDITVLPAGDYLFAKEYELEEKKGKIFLPRSNTKLYSDLYEVLRVGENIKKYKVGDIVIAGHNNGHLVYIKGEDYRMLYAADSGLTCDIIGKLRVNNETKCK